MIGGTEKGKQSEAPTSSLGRTMRVAGGGDVTATVLETVCSDRTRQNGALCVIRFTGTTGQLLIVVHFEVALILWGEAIACIWWCRESGSTAVRTTNARSDRCSRPLPPPPHT